MKYKEELMEQEKYQTIKKYQDTQYKIKETRKNQAQKINKSKCGWCGQYYIKTANKQKYCSNECRKNAIQEQSRIKSHRWYHRHKHELDEKQRWGLGSGVLGQHRHKDYEKEQKVITRELKRIGIYKQTRK